MLETVTHLWKNSYHSIWVREAVLIYMLFVNAEKWIISWQDKSMTMVILLKIVFLTLAFQIIDVGLMVFLDVVVFGTTELKNE